MRLVVIRHAAAAPRELAGVPDDERPLTRRGRRRFRRAARGLARLIDPPDVLLTSPRRRAVETARIAANAWKSVPPTVEHALASDDLGRMLVAIQGYPQDATVAIVGHEPALSALIARLLGSADGARFALRKGGAALVRVTAGAPASGRLVWYLRPRILRALGRR